MRLERCRVASKSGVKGGGDTCKSSRKGGA